MYSMLCFSWQVNGKKRQKGNSFVNSQSIIDRHNSNFCFFLSNILRSAIFWGFFVEYFASYQYNVWFLYAKVPGHSVTTRKKNNFTTDPSTIWSLLSLHTFFKIFNRSFWYIDILNILFQERRATSLSGFPTGFNSSFILFFFFTATCVTRFLCHLFSDLDETWPDDR